MWVKRFATVAFWEGVSYLGLLGIAMPLKYVWNWPWAVQVVGWAHGILFMAYGMLLLKCWLQYQWPFKRVALYFIASLLPIVPFVVEKQLKKEYNI